MRESNFAFPVQNRASVCISSQLYDRRALDTNSPLPLFNSLTHLTYLTATSPRIREIMTMDGGLERLVRILHDFCISPPPPENPAMLYGLLPTHHHPPPLTPTLNPKTWDRHAAYRFSLAFQCVVNIGVRGSEPIRSRVVKAGTLDVVGCVLEAWLASKGFATGPSQSATGMPRETREQRYARRAAQAESRNREQTREQAIELARALERQHAQRRQDEEQTVRRRITAAPQDEDDESMDTEQLQLPRTRTVRPSDVSAGPSRPRITTIPSDPSTDTSTETSTNSTPIGSSTPTGTVEVPGRERSGTIIARPMWDPSRRATATATTLPTHAERRPQSGETSAATSADNSRPETETEDDGDGLEGDVDMMDGDGDGDAEERSQGPLTDASPSPEPMARAAAQTSPHTRRAVGIVSDTTPTAASLEVNGDAHIIINRDQEIGVGGVGVAEGVGVEDGIVSLEPNDDFAMGAPPGAPGAIETTTINMTRTGTIRRGRHGVDVTPRAGNANLPVGTPRDSDDADTAEETRPNAPLQRNLPLPPLTRQNAVLPPDVRQAPVLAPRTAHAHHHHHHHHHRGGGLEKEAEGPYRDEDVLLSLQLLAYLSKYPHVRQAFYKPRASFHPATVGLQKAPSAAGPSATSGPIPPHKEQSNNFFKAFRGKEKERASPSSTAVSSSTQSPSRPSSSSATATGTTPATPQRQTNVFSLVERFTFRPSSTESDLPNPPPSLPQEIQYWAGVIMRNACRKDDSRGGIRQCANMLCGRWESYPREFAKCRRCRKAKYCGKECQSTAWSEGHRFWCSAKDGDDEAAEQPDPTVAGPSSSSSRQDPLAIPRRDRERDRDRERERDRDRVRERVVATTAAGVDSTQVARAMAHMFRNMGTLDTSRNWTAVLRDNPTATNAENGEQTQTLTRRQIPLPPAPGPTSWSSRAIAGPSDPAQGWGRAVYEPSPFGNVASNATAGPSGQQRQRQQERERERPGETMTVADDEFSTLLVGQGRRRAETMPGGMVPIVEGPMQTQPQPEQATGTAMRRGLEVEVAIAGPSGLGMSDDEGIYAMGMREEYPMDVD